MLAKDPFVLMIDESLKRKEDYPNFTKKSNELKAKQCVVYIILIQKFLDVEDNEKSF